MRAIVTKRNPNGSYDDVGMNNRYLTKHYKSIRTLLRYGVIMSTENTFRVEIFNHGIYQDIPDKIIYISKGVITNESSS